MINPIARLHPSSPDPVITKEIKHMHYDQAALPRFAHLNVVVDKINDDIVPALNTLLAEGYQGVIDCSTNPKYVAGFTEPYMKDWFWRVSVAGKIGGASGVSVEAGDMIICTVDNTLAGTQVQVGANFMIVEKNFRTLTQVLNPNEQSINCSALLRDGTSSPLMYYNVTISNVETFLLAANLGVTTALTAGNSVQGTHLALTGFTGDALLTRLIGHEIILNNPTGSGADGIGIHAQFAGNRTVANTSDIGFQVTMDAHNLKGGDVYGYHFDAQGLTINAVTSDVYGAYIDMTGITNTISNEVHGLKIITEGGVDSAISTSDGTRSVYLCYNGAYALYTQGISRLRGDLQVTDNAGTGAGIISAIAGRAITLQGGDGTGPSIGGDATIKAGISVTAAGGILNLFAGDGYTTGGQINITAGSSTFSGFGGNVEIHAGEAMVNGVGGSIMAHAGMAHGNNSAGSIDLKGGDNDGTASGGNVNATGGDASNNTGGEVHLVGGNSITTGDGGGIYLVGGDSSATGVGGSIHLTGGPAGGLGSTAGNIIAHSPFVVKKYTTAQRAALTAITGMIVFDSDTNKFQGYATAGWVDLN